MSNRVNTSDLDAVLAHRHDNGHDFWATPDGRIGVGTPFSTLESLLILYELGAGSDHEAVRGALDLVLAGWQEDGRFRLAPRTTIYPCHTANAVRMLVRFGYAEDPRLQQSFAHMLDIQHEDGGLRCRKFSGGRGPETAFSNPGITLFMLDALRWCGNDGIAAAADRAVVSLLDHWAVRRPIGPCHFGIGTLFHQIEFPFLRYNLFYYIYVLAHFERARSDQRFREAVAVFQEQLDADGRVIVQRPHRRLAKLDFCRKGEPSEIATRRYREILRLVNDS